MSEMEPAYIVERPHLCDRCGCSPATTTHGEDEVCSRCRSEAAGTTVRPAGAPTRRRMDTHREGTVLIGAGFAVFLLLSWAVKAVLS